MRMLNFQEADVSVLIGGDYGPGNGMYEPVAGVHIYDFANALVGPGQPNEVLSLDGGLIWAGGVSPAGITYDLTPGGGCRSAHDNTGNRTIVNRLAPANHAIAHSPAWGAWDMTWGATAIPAMTPSAIAHDHSGLWVIADGTVGGPGELKVSPGPGVALINPTVTPGFGGGSGPSVIGHTHHPAGHVYPDDPGNMCFVALNFLERSYSLDGQTWIAANPHGWAATPIDLAYSAHGTRWIATLTDGANAFIATSDDNFVSAGKSLALGVAGCPITSGIVNPAYFKIASDGFGDWVVGIMDPAGGDFELHVSWDNGDTWTRAYLPTAPVVTANSAMDIWYGGGRFVLWLDDPVAPGRQVFISLRGGE